MSKKKTMIASMVGFVLATTIIANAQGNENASNIKEEKEEKVLVSNQQFEADQDLFLMEQKKIAMEAKKVEIQRQLAEEKRIADEKKELELKLKKEKAEKEKALKIEEERKAKEARDLLEKKKAQKNQVKSVSNKKTGKTAQVEKGSFFVEGIGMSYEHQAYLYKMTQERGLEYLETLAFIGVESTYRANAQGGSNYGYFQINKINHARLSQALGTNNNPFDPYVNINWGTFMIADLHSKYGDWHSILSAYNKGEAGFRKTGHATNYIHKYDKILASLKAKK